MSILTAASAARSAGPLPRIDLIVSGPTLAGTLAQDRDALTRIEKAIDEADTDFINALDHPQGTAGREIQEQDARDRFADMLGDQNFSITSADAVKLAADLCHAVIEVGMFPHDTCVGRAYIELQNGLKLAAVDAIEAEIRKATA